MNTETTKMWSVCDRNAKTGPRAHEVPTLTDESGEVLMSKEYKLTAQTPTPMSADHAMFFLKDPAFIVRNDAGEIVTPVPKREGGVGGFRLLDDEIIATYEELSKEALFKRCKVHPGSEGIKQLATSRDDMVAFLKARAKPPVGRSRGSEDVIEELPAAELDRMGLAA